MKPTRSQFSMLQQICDLIPSHLVAKLAREHGADRKARTFSPWSHVVVMLYAQLAHSIGLNDVCDAVRIHRGKLRRIRGATPPSRNALSHANKVRPAKMAEALFWAVLDHLSKLSPDFGGRTYRGFPRRFKRCIHVVDSTTISLVANCVDWARHKRSKAGAKVHMRLDLQSFLPRFAVVDTARPSDHARAREICAGIGAGEIALFDRGYYDFKHLFELTERGVAWVTRAKENLNARCVKRLIAKPKGPILRDDLVILENPAMRQKYPQTFRRVRAVVELDGTPTEMVFLTNHESWAPATVADLYKRRWAIEAFFKQIKQTLQLCDFLGHSKNAIQWQVWTGLLAYVLLRYLECVSRWPHSFTRLFTLLRSSLFSRIDLLQLLHSYGIAGGQFRLIAAPQQAYLPGFAPP